jgi:putative ABC transport system permease protein
MGTILQDIVYGSRVLLKNPGYAAVAVLTLALGIGFTSAIFSLVDAIIIRPLPYPEPEQLVGLGQWRNQKGEGYIQTGVSAPNLDDIAKSGIFQQVAYYRWADFNLTESSRPERLHGIKASAELLPMFGVAPQLGRVDYFPRRPRPMRSTLSAGDAAKPCKPFPHLVQERHG